MDLEAKFKDTKDAIDKAQQRRARLIHEKELLEESLAESLAVLKMDYGVNSVEDAKNVLGTLEHNLVNLLKQAEKLLEEANNDS